MLQWLGSKAYYL